VLGIFYIEAGNFEEALLYCGRAMEIYQKLDNKIGIAAVHEKMGHMYLSQGLEDKALEHCHAALKVKQESGAGESKLASCYFNIGVCYANIDRLDLALSFYEPAQLAWEQLDKHRHLPILYNNLGSIFGKKGELESARKYFLKALDISEAAGERKQTASTLSNLGNLYEDLCEYEKAHGYYIKSLEIYQKLGNKRGIAYVSSCVGNVCTHLNRLDEAEKFISKGLELTKSLKIVDYEVICLERMTKLYEKKGDLKKALSYSRELNKRQKDHTNEKSIEKIATLQVQFETEKKEKEAEIYRLKNTELTEVNNQLREAIEDVKKLQGMLPICACCKKIRDDEGYWQQIESYISDNTTATFSHGICPECFIRLYGEDYSLRNSV